MADYRIKAAGSHSAALGKVIDKVWNYFRKSKQRCAGFSVSHQLCERWWKNRANLWRGYVRFIDKKRENTVGVGDVNFELQNFSYLTNAPYRAYGRTVIVLNPTTKQLNNFLQDGNTSVDWIAVEMTLDGELDSWVQVNQAADIWTYNYSSRIRAVFLLPSLWED